MRNLKYLAIVLFLSLSLLTSCGGSGGGTTTTPSPTTTTPTVATGKVPDTGQTTKYSTAFGDDSDHTINPPSYTDDADGTITDNVTGLIWQKCSAGQNATTCSGTALTYKWYEASGTADATYNAGGATNVCGSLTTGGQTDWRLPNSFELMAIADSEIFNPAINGIYFPSTLASYYWSTTAYVDFPSNAWYADFRYGLVDKVVKTTSIYVRCVRGTESSVQSFTDNGDGTITDNVTTMMWQKCSNGQNATGCSGTAGTSRWEQAITYCEGLSLAGNSDWRLPNKNELASIVDYTRRKPAINSTYFRNTVSSPYWSATTIVSSNGSTSFAWYVGFDDGTVRNYGKSNYEYVRCVR